MSRKKPRSVDAPEITVVATKKQLFSLKRLLVVLALVALALDLWHGYLQLSQLYGFAFVFGLLTAFALPASQALLLSSGINRFGTHAKHALPEAA